MENFEEKILDRFNDEPSRTWIHHWSIVFVPISLFAIGVLFRFMHWPYARIIMAVGLILILLRSCIFFFTKKRSWDEWFYFLGRVSLISVLAIDFAFFPMNRKIMLLALTFFAIGVLIYVVRKKKAADEVENQEDDY
jgi:predicted membrane channel-forming protein YqfA (hemolysin III family)